MAQSTFGFFAILTVLALFSLIWLFSRNERTSRRGLYFRPALEILGQRILPAATAWTGGGVNSIWSNAANWTNAIPTDEADFDNRTAKASVVDAAFTNHINTLKITNYTGTITISNTLTVIGTFTQGSGTVTIGSGEHFYTKT
jgi:hypothetical protein